MKIEVRTVITQHLLMSQLHPGSKALMKRNLYVLFCYAIIALFPKHLVLICISLSPYTFRQLFTRCLRTMTR